MSNRSTPAMAASAPAVRTIEEARPLQPLQMPPLLDTANELEALKVREWGFVVCVVASLSHAASNPCTT